MKDRNVKSLTEGSPFKILILFTLPLLLGLAFQQLYGMIDTIVVGRFLGVDALAGVGSTGPINFLILGFCSGICSGFAIPVAQKFGEKDLPGLRRIVGNIVWLSAAFSVVITLLVCLMCRRILTWMHTPEETFSYAYDYIFIIFLGIPSMILYNVLSGIIRSLGNSRVPLYFLLFSSALNIVLDLVLILKAGMGVAGAAWATVISQIVSGLMCLVYIVRSCPVLKLGRDDLRPRRQESGKLLSMGVPMGLQYTVTAVGCTVLQGAVNVLGPTAMAAVSAANRVQSLLVTPFDSIGISSATYVGQNTGAGDIGRIRGGVRAGLLMGAVWCVLGLCTVYLWGENFLMLFLDPSGQQTGEILAWGQKFLILNAVNYLPLVCVNLFRSAVQGMGYSVPAVLAGVLELAGRAAAAFMFVPSLGFTAVCLASPAAWILADIFLIPMYFYGLKVLRLRIEGSK